MRDIQLTSITAFYMEISLATAKPTATAEPTEIEQRATGIIVARAQRVQSVAQNEIAAGPAGIHDTAFGRGLRHFLHSAWPAAKVATKPGPEEA